MVMMMKKRAESFIVEMREDDDNERCCCLLLVVCCLLLFDLCQICVPLSMNVVGGRLDCRDVSKLSMGCAGENKTSHIA